MANATRTLGAGHSAPPPRRSAWLTVAAVAGGPFLAVMSTTVVSQYGRKGGSLLVNGLHRALWVSALAPRAAVALTAVFIPRQHGR